MNILPNYVLIEPDANHDTATSGVDMGDEYTGHLNVSISGKVVDVCPSLNYFGMAIRNIKTKLVRSAFDMFAMSRMINASSLMDVPVEIKKGDTVLFPYIYRIQRVTFEEEAFGKYIIVPYCDLFARVDADGIYPLSGALLARKVKTEDPVVALRRGEQWNNVCEVIAEGCMVRDYKDYGIPDKESMVGKKVIVRQNMQVSLETPSQMRFFKDRIYTFHRRHVLGYVQ